MASEFDRAYLHRRELEREANRINERQTREQFCQKKPSYCLFTDPKLMYRAGEDPHEVQPRGRYL